MNEEHLKELLKKWQPRLGLSDWKINIKFLDYLDINHNIAQVQKNVDLQTAEIRILNPKDRQASNLNHQNIEQDLVHELVHLRFWFLKNPENDTENTLQEQAVEWISRALVN
jgi:hypothetical protein